MPPKNVDVNACEVDDDLVTGSVEPVLDPRDQKFLPLKIVWFNVAWFAVLHLVALYGLYLLPFAHPYTWLFSMYFFFTYMAIM